jgi:hypothetical protein
MPCSSRPHRAPPPFEPPDGVCRCFLATSPPESSRPWQCRWCCLLLAAVGGARPCGGWRSLVIVRLQGFSSCSPAAVPHQWSSRRMTTSLVVGKSVPGCGIPAALSLKDVHHPCWGGGCAEPRPCLPHGLATRFFLQHSGEKGVHQPGGGGELPPASWSGCGSPSTARATVAPSTGPACPRLVLRRRPHRGAYKTSYAAGAVSSSLDGPVLTPMTTGVRTSLCALGRPPFTGAALRRR